MIVNKKSIYLLCLIISIGVLILLTSHFAIEERRTCAAAPILTEKEYSCLEESDSFDATSFLMQNDHPVARDTTTNTIYISIPPLDDLNFWELPARLSSSHPEYSLCFAPDQAFEDFRTAVAQNHVFTLLVVRENRFVPYSVVFTTLPVLELNAFTLAERHDIHRGSFTLWDSNSSESGYSIASSEAEWHTRGGASKSSAKPPYKIALKKTESTENRNLALLNLGKDDDWILNSMVFDDLKIREKVVSSFWNVLQDTMDPTLKTTGSEYVEVLINGTYSGLYLLQRRVDSKFLGSSRADDILFKSSDSGSRTSVEAAFLITSNPNAIEEQLAYQQMLPIYQAITSSDDLQHLPNINIDNWIDINILTSAFAAKDNRSYKNMYYLLHKQNDHYVLEFVPWDMDLTFGLDWNGKVFFNPDVMLRTTPYLRLESTTFFKLEPSLEYKLALRWKDLRSNLLSLDHLTSFIHSLRIPLSESGSLVRDQNKWGLYHNGEDSLESLVNLLSTHLSLMDTYYQSVLDGG